MEHTELATDVGSCRNKNSALVVAALLVVCEAPAVVKTSLLPILTCLPRTGL